MNVVRVNLIFLDERSSERMTTASLLLQRLLEDLLVEIRKVQGKLLKFLVPYFGKHKIFKKNVKKVINRIIGSRSLEIRTHGSNLI